MMAPKNKKKQAVALQYNRIKDTAPKVTAKGQGKVTENIIALALAHGVPVKDDPELMEVLASLEISQEIPPEIYVAVAELLSFIYGANAGKKS